ncbi:hypothetical protein CEXT_489031 [Caerostris extrusa]|uniref:Uncharacterized protein n=1 Tax=Caerostris extrusa TaxID=172846 RepID=A0AAV4RCG1_CAEEX|nr:hypothetical protein CEXT_489031 [Caerostris extrusa]
MSSLHPSGSLRGSEKESAQNSPDPCLSFPNNAISRPGLGFEGLHWPLHKYLREYLIKENLVLSRLITWAILSLEPS